MEFTVFGFTFNHNIIIILFLMAFIGILILTRCVTCVNVKEGFAPIDYQMGHDISTSLMNWRNAMQNGAKGKAPSGPQSANRPAEADQASAPSKTLDEGSMFMFDDTTFSPECCPSDYSNSSGCACTTGSQMDFLNERGGNRTEASMY